MHRKGAGPCEHDVAERVWHRDTMRPGMVPAMADGRKRSAAKQARRDARRGKARRGRVAEQETPEEAPLIDEVREALEGGQPMDLLGLVSMLIMATVPPPALPRPPDVENPPSLDELVSAFIDVPVPETTALLAVLGQLLLGDDPLSERCRREVDARGEELPAVACRACANQRPPGDADVARSRGR